MFADTAQDDPTNTEFRAQVAKEATAAGKTDLLKAPKAVMSTIRGVLRKQDTKQAEADAAAISAAKKKADKVYGLPKMVFYPAAIGALAGLGFLLYKRLKRTPQ